MSKILANQIANYLDNAPIEIKEGLNIPAGKPLQVDGGSGAPGEVLSSSGTGLAWSMPSYFSGAYADLTGLPTIPAAQINSDWTATTGVARILNKPTIPPQSSVVLGPAQGGGDLSYNNVNGEFTFTPPNLSSYSTFSGSYDDLSGKPDLSVYLTTYTETDPVFTASPASSITGSNKTNWNAAYGWGDHGVAGYLTAEADTLDSVTSRGNSTNNDIAVQDLTVNGDLVVVGNTSQNNVATLNVSANEIIINDGTSGAPALNGTLKIDRGSSVDTSIRWNETTDRWEFTNDGSTYYNIAIGTNDLTNNAGFLTSYNETDPVFTASDAAGIGSVDITNWNAAYGWGNHASAGYLTAEADTLDAVVGRGATTSLAATFGDLTCSNLTVTGTTTQINTTQLTVSDNLVVLNNDVSVTPTENAGVEVERGLQSNVKLLWNEGTDRWTFTNNGSAYYPLAISLGDLTNDVGYITSYTETDPVFGASAAASITTTELSQWNAAYGWGNHASAGYLTAEADTLDSVTGRNSTSGNKITLNSSTTNSILEFKLSSVIRGNITPEATALRVSANGSNDLNLQCNDFGGDDGDVVITSGGASGTYPNGNVARMAVFTGTGTAELWYQDAKKLETTGTGVTITGALTVTGGNSGDWNTAFGWGNHSSAGYLIDITSQNLGDLSNVDTSSASAGDVLKYDGTSWAPAADATSAGGGSTANVLTQDTEPSSPADGDLWWKSDDGVLKVYYDDGNTTQWVNASPGGGGGSTTVTTSDNAPSSPADGDLWWKSDEGKLKVYYQDTDSSQWVDASPTPPLTNPNVPVAVGYILLDGTSPTWTGTSGYTVSGTQPGGAGTDYVITLTFPTAYSARTDYIVQATYDSTGFVSGNGASIGVVRGTSSVVFTPRRWNEDPLSLGEIMITITNL